MKHAITCHYCGHLGTEPNRATALTVMHQHITDHHTDEGK